MTYLHIICKYYQTSENGEVLGHLVQDLQRSIPLKKKLNSLCR